MTPDTEFIRGSDGSGEAVRAAVTTPRAIGATTLVVDNLTGFSSKFIFTSGNLDSSTGELDPNTITVAYGESDTSSPTPVIDILAYAPGYSDIGHNPGDVIILKPTTAWADNIADIIKEQQGKIDRYHADDIIIKIDEEQPAPDPEGGIILWIDPSV